MAVLKYSKQNRAKIDKLQKEGWRYTGRYSQTKATAKRRLARVSIANKKKWNLKPVALKHYKTGKTMYGFVAKKNKQR